MPRLTETRASRATLPQTGQSLIWCSEISGFGCRLLATGVRTWIVQLRYRGKSHRLSLGRVGVLPIEGPEDRPGAADLARLALNAARRGLDPKEAIGKATRPQGMTLAEIWTAYGKAGFPRIDGIGFKRASSIKTDGYRWRKHVTRIAYLPAASIDTAATQRWLDTIADVGARSHALGLLKAVLTFAETRGFCSPQKINIKARPSRQIENFLKPDELKRLDGVLAALAREQPNRMMAFAALRLMLHTGCRKSEILTATWSMIDLEARTLRLESDKVDEDGRTVLLSDAAVAVLRGLPRLARGGFVFLGRRRDGHLTKIEKPWYTALKRAGLRYVRPHDLRHSFASAAIGAGASLYVTGNLLGHRNPRTTQRYAHLSHEAEREAVSKIARLLA